MKLRPILISLLVVAVALTCVRLGFWQITRWHEKRAMNVALRSALTAPPIEIGDHPPALDAVRGRRVRAAGHYDESRQLLLSARTHDGSPGVHVVTPLVVANGSSAILVDRGWVYAGDAATAPIEELREPGPRSVIGMVEAPRRGAGGASLRVLRGDSLRVWSARWVDLDSIGARVPYALAPFVVRQLPGPGVPEHPVRLPPTPYDESMHVSYAIQWFLFATILIVGSLLLARSRKKRASGDAVAILDLPARPR